MSCKLSEVALCLERTNPQHPPSFYNALEVVKRYARAKIADGKRRPLAGRGGKLEILEQRFAHQGFQDIFYLTRLHLRLPPSTLNLPNPSCPVRKTLLKAGYPLPPQPDCDSGRPLPSFSRPASPKSAVPRPEIRRGSKSLDLEPTPSVPSSSRSRSHDSPSKVLPVSGGMKRSTSSRPDLPSSKAGSSSRSVPTSLSPKSFSTGSSPISPSLSAKSREASSGRWTPLLSGLGIKLFDNHHHRHHDPHLYDTSPPNPRVPFTLDPFAKELPTPTLLKTPSISELPLSMDCPNGCDPPAHHDGRPLLATLEVVISRQDELEQRERGYSLLEALGETEKDFESLFIAKHGSVVGTPELSLTR
ncbi:hypothetical protein I316_00773 [Kwoniella heveanensis BCC8398]|uniref:Uncharacterized protein n=1 Tax=Kwoniella heveanensis BCC8398 TaxID=1296120 RepID=A0A1B9H2Z2_9TREE|nr:hypothetical protein I316_00773 [Kwoniella heveanensis BCC8398]